MPSAVTFTACARLKRSGAALPGVPTGVRVVGDVAAVSRPDRDHVFKLDACYGPATTTRDIYEQRVDRIVREFATSGVNGSVFAVGAEGSGKTTTLFGDEDLTSSGIVSANGGAGGWISRTSDGDVAAGPEQPDAFRDLAVAGSASDDVGLIPRALAVAFSLHSHFRVTALEVSHDQVVDLLQRRAVVRLRETATKRFVADGAAASECTTFGAAMKAVREAVKHRTRPAGPATHFVLFIDRMVAAEVKPQPVLPPLRRGTGKAAASPKSKSITDGLPRRQGRLLFSDVAPNNKGIEMKNSLIDTSVITLGSCLESVTKRARQGLALDQIPQFRNCAFTKVCKGNLVSERNSSLLLCTASMEQRDAAQTLQTLRYADRVRGLTARAAAAGVRIVTPPLELAYDADGQPVAVAPKLAPAAPVEPDAADADDESDSARRKQRNQAAARAPLRRKSSVASLRVRPLARAAGAAFNAPQAASNASPARNSIASKMTALIGQEQRHRRIVETEQEIEFSSAATAWLTKATFVAAAALTREPQSARAPPATMSPKPPAGSGPLTARGATSKVPVPAKKTVVAPPRQAFVKAVVSPQPVQAERTPNSTTPPPSKVLVPRPPAQSLPRSGKSNAIADVAESSMDSIDRFLAEEVDAPPQAVVEHHAASPPSKAFDGTFGPAGEKPLPRLASMVGTRAVSPTTPPTPASRRLSNPRSEDLGSPTPSPPRSPTPELERKVSRLSSFRGVPAAFRPLLSRHNAAPALRRAAGVWVFKLRFAQRRRAVAVAERLAQAQEAEYAAQTDSSVTGNAAPESAVEVPRDVVQQSQPSALSRSASASSLPPTPSRTPSPFDEAMGAAAVPRAPTPVAPLVEEEVPEEVPAAIVLGAPPNDAAYDDDPFTEEYVD